MATPLNFLWLLVAIGLGLRFWKQKLGNKILIFSGIIFLTVGIFPIGYNMMVFLETRYQRPTPMPTKVDGIIVLGGAFNSALSEKRGMIAANGNIERMIDFVDLSHKYPKARLIFSGGSGNIYNLERKEADDAKTFFDMMGVSTRHITFERNSHNSYENIKYSKKLMQPKEGETWLLVTSAFHIPRTMGILKQQDWKVIPYPADPKTDGAYKLLPQQFGVVSNFSMLGLAMKEFIGSIIYYFSGKSAFLFPVTALESDKFYTAGMNKNGVK